MYTQYTARSQVLGVYVSLVMFRQVVTPHEAFLTLVALEALVTCDEKQKQRVGIVKCGTGEIFLAGSGATHHKAFN